MQIKISQVLLSVFFSTFVLLPINANQVQAPMIDPIAAHIEITPREFLKQEVKRQGLTERDSVILSAIIQCESGWEQFWTNSKNGHKIGEVKVSNGNIGLFQINKGAHHAEYERLGLDPYKPFDNLTYGVLLYKRGGIKAWDQWSGHCWRPALAKQGIYFGLEARAGKDGGQCVEFIQSLFKKTEKFKDRAIDIVPNTDKPAVGIVVLTTESDKGHAAYIYKMTDTELFLAESNYGMDEKITVGRRLLINSPVIRGYFDFNKN
jgi:hypothetical protein